MCHKDRTYINKVKKMLDNVANVKLKMERIRNLS